MRRWIYTVIMHASAFVMGEANALHQWARRRRDRA